MRGDGSAGDSSGLRNGSGARWQGTPHLGEPLKRAPILSCTAKLHRHVIRGSTGTASLPSPTT